MQRIDHGGAGGKPSSAFAIHEWRRTAGQLSLSHSIQRAAVRELAFQRHPEALPFAAAFRGHHQHERSFVLWNVFNAINDGKGELIDETFWTVMDDRNGVLAGQEPIGGVGSCFCLQNLMQRAHAYHVTEFHMVEILLLAGQ